MLSDLKVAIIADHGVRQSELAGIRENLGKAGINVCVVSAKSPEINAVDRDENETRIKVDKNFSDVVSDEYAGTIVPGGEVILRSPQVFREAINFLKQQFSAGKIIAALNEGVEALIVAELLKEKKATSIIALKSDIVNAGGIWSDEPITIDNGIITCHCENDVTAFTNVLLEQLKSGIQQRTETII